MAPSSSSYRSPNMMDTDDVVLKQKKKKTKRIALKKTMKKKKKKTTTRTTIAKVDKDAEKGRGTLNQEYQLYRNWCLSFHIGVMRDEIVDSLWNCEVLIVVAPPKSHKSECLPLYLALAGFAFGDKGCVAWTSPTYSQPARAEVAEYTGLYARSRRLKITDNVQLPGGGEGYRVSGAMIKFRSVDSLLQEMVAARDRDRDRDPLSSYSVIIVDDAHQRTLSTDLLLGSLIPLMVRRRHTTTTAAASASEQQQLPPLRLVLTVTQSASHEAAKLSSFFGQHCSTKTCIHPIDPLRSIAPVISYVDPRTIERLRLDDDDDDEVEVVLSVALGIHRCELPQGGNILVFLGGSRKSSAEQRVDEVCHYVRNWIANSSNPKDKTLLVYPLYAGTTIEARKIWRQLRYTRIPDKRILFILSPDVPSSWHLRDCVNYIVDPGIGKDGEWISKQSADDRLASIFFPYPFGKKPPLRCVRLYNDCVLRNEPEILNCGAEQLTDFLRLMKLVLLGITDPSTFNFIDPPHPEALALAMEKADLLPDMSRLSLS